MSQTTPSNPMDDSEGKSNPIASKIPQGKSYWLAVIVLMIAGGFWQYYVIYHYHPAQPIVWQKFQPKKFSDAKIVHRPILILVTDLEKEDQAKLIAKLKEIHRPESKEGSEEAKSEERPLSTVDTLANSTSIFAKDSFRSSFNRKGGRCFVASTTLESKELKEALGRDAEMGFYYLDHSSAQNLHFSPSSSQLVSDLSSEDRK